MGMDIHEILNKPNVIIFFFMDGCPYCIKTDPFWEELKKKYKNKFQYFKIESQDVDDNLKNDLGINGFPHFIIKKNGKELRSPGSKESLKDLEKGLQLGGSSCNTRGRQFLRGRGRRTRKLRRSIRKRT